MDYVTDTESPIIRIRRSHDWLVFVMEYPYIERPSLYWDGPWRSCDVTVMHSNKAWKSDLCFIPPLQNCILSNQYNASAILFPISNLIFIDSFSTCNQYDYKIYESWWNINLISHDMDQAYNGIIGSCYLRDMFRWISPFWGVCI